jgi:hypothetical protein
MQLILGSMDVDLHLILCVCKKIQRSYSVCGFVGSLYHQRFHFVTLHISSARPPF